MCLLLAGCSENPPVVEKPLAGPEVISVSPENGVEGVTGKELTVTVIFESACLLFQKISAMH